MEPSTHLKKRYVKRKLLSSFNLTVLLLFLFLSQLLYSQASPSGISISWNSEVGCQVVSQFDDGRKDPITLEDIADNSCINVCEGSQVTYTLSGPIGPGTTIWNVAGGIIVNSNNETCTVLWGLVGSGGISLSIPTHSGAIVKNICITKIIKPTAVFDILPTAERETEFFTACVNQSVNFHNMSTDNGGTGLVPPSYWDFGDGSYSTAFEPSHTYSHAGTYEITLTVSNSCHCTSTYKKRIIVSEDSGFEISCPGVVCEGQSVTYHLPKEISVACKGSYSWSVSGGAITDVNQSNGDVTVIWNQVDASGFGYLTYDPKKCGLKCATPTTIKIPVILNHGTIAGDLNICLKSQTVYKLPQWPTTDVIWSIDGNEAGTIAEVVLSDQRNEVYVTPLVTGSFMLRATYTNTLLDCGGTAKLYINVTEPVLISGDELVCNFSTGNYISASGVYTNWTLTDNNGTVVDTAPYSPNYSFYFEHEGGYTLSSGSATTCPAQQFSITVLPRPLNPASSEVSVLTNGNWAPATSVEVCPNAPYTYSIAVSPLYQYRWEISPSIGTIIGSAVGNQVSISFTGAAPAQFIIYRESISPKVCPSRATTVPINIKHINASISFAKSSVCANSNANYSVVKTGILPETAFVDGETYNWSITPNTLGSITSGQGTNAISILWNNTDIVATATISLTINKCTLSSTITKVVTVNPLPQIEIVATPTTFCSGTQISYSLSSTNGVPIDSGTVTWNFGGTEINSSIVSGNTIQPFTFMNVTGVNIGQNVTAYITNANECGGLTNTATIGVTVLPGPPAALSLSTQFNAFCTKQQIYAVVTVASGTSGITFEWYKDGVLLPLSSFTTSLTIAYPYYGFGNYYFIATNAAGCRTYSNTISIVKFCPDEHCDYYPEPELTNTSTQSCAVLNLNGSASGTPSSTYWRITGPNNVALINYTAPTYTVTSAGEFHTYYTAEYLNESTGIICVYTEYKKVLVPYIPDFSYSSVCNGNNSFLVTLTDKTSFFAPVDNRSVTYQYRSLPFLPSNPWLPVTGSVLPILTAGNYQIKIIVQGDYNGVTQPVCEKIINLPLASVPNQNINSSNIDCYNSAVAFNTDNAIVEDSYFWTFEPGSINEATNTLQFPKRVFPTSGIKTVTVVITNKYGCTREFTTTVTIPEKCFNGTITSFPDPATVCAGTPVKLSYTPSGTECTPTQYIWMNGQTPITPAQNTPSIQVSNSGFYWVIVKQGNCTYETPNRITPLIKSAPSVSLELPGAVCAGEGVKVKAITNGTFLRWTIDGVNQAMYDNQSNIIIYSLSLGNHTIVVTAYSGDPNSATTCSASVSKTISIVMPPSEPVITQDIICAGDDPEHPYYHVVLTATSNVPGVFNWSNGATGSTITVMDGGPVQVRVTNGGCSSSSQIDVPKNPEDYIWIFPSGCMFSCISEKGQPTIIGPRLPISEWTWLQNGNGIQAGHDSFTEPLPLTTGGTYQLDIKTNPCGITSAPLDFTANKDCSKCALERLDVSKITAVEGPFCSFTFMLDITTAFAFNGQLVAPNDDFVVVPTQLNLIAGSNQILITVIPLGSFNGDSVLFQFDGFLENGEPCINQFYIILPSCFDNTNNFTKPTSEKAIVRKGSVTMAPNPAHAEVVIRYDALESGSTIELFDLTGRSLSNYKVTGAEGSWTIPTSTYPAGVYLVVVRSNGELITQQKLIVK